MNPNFLPRTTENVTPRQQILIFWPFSLLFNLRQRIDNGLLGGSLILDVPGPIRNLAKSYRGLTWHTGSTQPDDPIRWYGKTVLLVPFER